MRAVPYTDNMRSPLNWLGANLAPTDWVGRITHWWRGQAPHRQDRYAVLAPLLAVLLFFVAIIVSFAYLRLEEIEREHEAIRHDVEYAQQGLRLRLLERQEQLMRITQELSNKSLDIHEFKARADTLISQFPELQQLSWLDDKRRIKAGASSANLPYKELRRVGETPADPSIESNFFLARDLQQPIYDQRISSPDSTAFLQLHIPMTQGGRFSGVLLAEYSVDGLYRYAVPREIISRYAVSFLDGVGQRLAGSAIPVRNQALQILPWAQPINEYEVPVSPVGNGLILRGQAYRSSLGVIGSGLFWLVSVLSVLTSWMLIANWRHTKRRQQTQQALVAETNFRRAMENSISTGMRAMDLQGRITYVNTAFCQMTGWSEDDLLGKLAPYPYWPEDDRASLMLLLQEELDGRTPQGGIQVRIKRSDDSLFDARLYVSPLIDSRGAQTGWMTSITDITEPNRVREQLSASFERFTTVMDSLDASVSVAPVGTNELLFSNRLYRQWFGGRLGHLQLLVKAGITVDNSRGNEPELDLATELPSDPIPGDLDRDHIEIYLSNLGKWIEVRIRHLKWVDGRPVQMVIASDISARRLAEEQSAAQEARAHNISRLVTMGEMASTVAHELNQPLTAISNYCSGMLTRIKAQQMEESDLLGALEKTAHQAQRAGQIIHRIRSFVRRSEPNRTLTEVAPMVNEAVDLAEIELRRHQVQLSYQLEENLPAIRVDRILIEQVLINLLKNAAESIQAAQRDMAHRRVELTVKTRMHENKPVIEFDVTDRGQGISPEVMERMYQAFFSTKADGMGMGLNLCRSIVESHQGRISAENLYNGAEVTGCRVSLWLPITGTQTKGDDSLHLQPMISG